MSSKTSRVNELRCRVSFANPNGQTLPVRVPGEHFEVVLQQGALLGAGSW